MVKLQYFKILLTVLIFSTTTKTVEVNAQNIKDVLSSEEKIYGLSTIWSEVKNNFVFMDKVEVDFDSLYQATIPKVLKAKNNFEYIITLVRFMNHLNDGHTEIDPQQFFWNQADFPAVWCKKKDDFYVVDRIANTYVNKIPLNSKLLEVDGIPYEEYRKTNITRSLIGYVDSEVTLKFETPYGKIVDENFIRDFNKRYRTPNPYTMISRKGKSKNDKWVEYDIKNTNGYSLVTINTFSNDTVVKLFKRDIDRINSSKGLILDVRKNGGGNSAFSKAIAKHLVKDSILLGPMWKTKINHSAKKAWGSMAILGSNDEWTKTNEKYWKNNAWETNPPERVIIDENLKRINVPIAILMGKNTFSAAEDFLIYTLSNPKIKKIGENSAGSSGQPLIINLPGGSQARICTKRDMLPNGEDYIGIGIKPDIKIDKDVDAIKVAIEELEKV